MSSGPQRVDSGALADRLAAIVGDERVSRRPAVVMHDVPAPLAVSPADEDQLSAVLAFADREGLGICLAGGGTKLGWGNRPRRLDLMLSTLELRGFSHVDADNLSLSVAAGEPISAVRAQAASIGRILPLDPRSPSRATVGGVTATGDQGARGAAYGGLRDVVLGLRAVLADGSVVKFGGRTMKNVSGYDLTKLFIGSFGVLGVITEVTFRLLPRPDKQALMMIPLRSLAQGRELAAQVLASHLQPLALEVVSPSLMQTGWTESTAVGTAESSAADKVGEGAQPGTWLLLAGFAGHPAAVSRSLEEVRGACGIPAAIVLDDERAEAALDALADAVPVSVPVAAGPRPGLALRASVPISEVWGLAEEAALRGWAAGLAVPTLRVGAFRGTVEIWVTAQSASEPELGRFPSTPGPLAGFVSGLRDHAVASGGHLVVTDGLVALPPDFDAWGDPGPSVGVMGRIKERFDPHGILNPGRFVGGM